MVYATTSNNDPSASEASASHTTSAAEDITDGSQPQSTPQHPSLAAAQSAMKDSSPNTQLRNQQQEIIDSLTESAGPLPDGIQIQHYPSLMEGSPSKSMAGSPSKNVESYYMPSPYNNGPAQRQSVSGESSYYPGMYNDSPSRPVHQQQNEMYPAPASNYGPPPPARDAYYPSLATNFGPLNFYNQHQGHQHHASIASTTTNGTVGGGVQLYYPKSQTGGQSSTAGPFYAGTPHLAHQNLPPPPMPSQNFPQPPMYTAPGSNVGQSHDERLYYDDQGHVFPTPPQVVDPFPGISRPFRRVVTGKAVAPEWMLRRVAGAGTPRPTNPYTTYQANHSEVHSNYGGSQYGGSRYGGGTRFGGDARFGGASEYGGSQGGSQYRGSQFGGSQGGGPQYGGSKFGGAQFGGSQFGGVSQYDDLGGQTPIAGGPNYPSFPHEGHRVHDRQVSIASTADTSFHTQVGDYSNGVPHGSHRVHDRQVSIASTADTNFHTQVGYYSNGVPFTEMNNRPPPIGMNPAQSNVYSNAPCGSPTEILAAPQPPRLPGFPMHGMRAPVQPNNPGPAVDPGFSQGGSQDGGRFVDEEFKRGEAQGSGRLYDPSQHYSRPIVSTTQPSLTQIIHDQTSARFQRQYKGQIVNIATSGGNIGGQYAARGGALYSQPHATSSLQGHRTYRGPMISPPLSDGSQGLSRPMGPPMLPPPVILRDRSLIPHPRPAPHLAVYAKRPYDVGPVEENFSSTPPAPTEEVIERLLARPIPESAVGRGFVPMTRVIDPNGAKALALDVKGKGKLGGHRVPAEVNCCLYIEGLHPAITYRDLFQQLRGKILRTHITPPQGQYKTAAAKIGFCTRAAAVATFNHIMHGGMWIRGRRVDLVRWNWDGHTEDDVYFKHQTRVLVIEGPKDIMSFELFENTWAGKIHYDLESRFQVPCSNAGRVRYEYRFGSIANQAEAAKWIIEREPILAGLDYEVKFGQDPCDD